MKPKYNLYTKINNALDTADWQFERQVVVAPGRFKITGDDSREVKEVAEYLLRYNGVSLAVVEPVDKVADLESGKYRATCHAQRAGLIFGISTDGDHWLVHNLSSKESNLLHAVPTPHKLLELSSLPLTSATWGTSIIARPYEAEEGRNSLKFYQERAILAVLSHFAKENPRAILLTSEKTDATYTVFQLTWKLLNSCVVSRKRVLFLAGSEHRIDEAYQCFAPFKNKRCIIEGGARPLEHEEVFFATPRMMHSDRDHGNAYKDFAPNFFDLVIVDQCQSLIGTCSDILTHFAPASQLGLANTPHQRSFDYFGEPVFIYSMAQAVNDGYLLPFLVESRSLFEKTISHNPSVTEDLERALVSEDYSRRIATDLWTTLSRFDPNQRKTLVFCANNTHAELITSELHRISKNPSFAVHLSSSRSDNSELIDEFTAASENGPRVAVFAETALYRDIPDLSNIAIARPINDPAIITSLISQGALPCTAIGKRYFTVFDYTNSTHRLDSTWTGHPENDVYIASSTPASDFVSETSSTYEDDYRSEHHQIIRNKILEICNNRLQGLYALWISRHERTRFRLWLSSFQLIETLRSYDNAYGIDEVDLLAKYVFDLDEVPTRKDRVENFWGFNGPWLRKKLGLKANSFEHDGNTGSWKLVFWRVTLDHYSLYGIDPLELGRTYCLPKFVSKYGSFQTLTSDYGGPKKLKQDLEAVKERLYQPVVSAGDSLR